MAFMKSGSCPPVPTTWQFPVSVKSCPKFQQNLFDIYLIASYHLRLHFPVSRFPFKYYISNSVWYLIFPVRPKFPIPKLLRLINLILFCYYKLLCSLLILNVFHFWPRQVLLRRTYLKLWNRGYEHSARIINAATVSFYNKAIRLSSFQWQKAARFVTKYFQFEYYPSRVSQDQTFLFLSGNAKQYLFGSSISLDRSVKWAMYDGHRVLLS
jgi:hypothetical protein